MPFPFFFLHCEPRYRGKIDADGKDIAVVKVGVLHRLVRSLPVSNDNIRFKILQQRRTDRASGGES